MINLQKFSVSMVGAALIALGTGQIAQAVLLVESESAVVNLDAKEVLFTIDFNRVPDFFTLDQVGRQADSFQYFIEADGEFPIFRGHTIVNLSQLFAEKKLMLQVTFGYVMSSQLAHQNQIQEAGVTSVVQYHTALMALC